MKKHLKRLRVEKLFGIFDHDVALTNRDRVTILHGPNGYGKTTLLKMIAAFCGADASIFTTVAFHRFIAEFTDGSSTVIVQDPGNANEGRKILIEVHSPDGGIKEVTPAPFSVDVPSQVLDMLDQFVPSPYARFGSGWRDRPNGKLLKLADIIRLFPNVAERVPKEYKSAGLISGDEFVPAFFVETKRLEAELSAARRGPSLSEFRLHTPPILFDDDEIRTGTTLRVEQYSKDIVDRIKTAIANYARYSQESDRTFPERLVKFIRDASPTRNAKELLMEMAKLEEERRRLMSLGFLDKETGLRDLAEADLDKVRAPLTIYVDDVNKKLAIFSDLAMRIGTLIDVLNARFRYKKLSLHKEYGFQLRSASGDVVSLDSLSSGEQHELVVNYELLFRAPNDGIVLVDEPEISLHVGWQSRFLEDFQRVLALNRCYGIIATHSPVVIGSRWDLTSELKGPDEKEAAYAK